MIKKSDVPEGGAGLGIFATIALKKGRVIMRERTPLCASSHDDEVDRCSCCRGPIKGSVAPVANCCNRHFCSTEVHGPGAYDVSQG